MAAHEKCLTWSLRLAFLVTSNSLVDTTSDRRTLQRYVANDSLCRIVSSVWIIMRKKRQFYASSKLAMLFYATVWVSMS
jgi:hypothetical protein